MKVAHVGPYPRESETHAEHGLGGVAAYVKNLVDGMRGQADLLVVAPTDLPQAAVRHDGAVEVREVDRTGRGVARALRALAKDSEVDAVHVQFEQHLFGGPLQNLRLALGLRRLARQKRVVLTVHQVPDLAQIDGEFLRRNGFPPVPFLARLWMRVQYALLIAACHVALVHEERLRDQLVTSYAIDAARIAVVPHGVDAGELPCGRAEAKGRLGIAPYRQLVLYFGYVTGYKGVDLLVDALERMPAAKREQVQVIIAGKVPARKMESAPFRVDMESLEARIIALGAWVTRKGFLSPADISLHLAAADVVVFPYRQVFGASGPLSITIGHGRPFLASDAFRGMGVPEESLFALDGDALAAKLRAYLSDASLRSRLEAEARRVAEEHAWPRVAERTCALYAKRAPRVLLMGAYGQDNLGDEALLEVHLQQLAPMHVTVASTDPVQTARRYGIPSVRTYGGLATLKAFLDSDAVVFGGGSVMKELPKPYPRHRVVASLAVLSTFAHGLGRGVAFSAVGVEKIDTPTGRMFARQAERASDLMQVRDEGSRSLLRTLGVGERARVVADAAYLLRADEAALRRADDVLVVAGGHPVVVLNPIASHEVARSAEEVVEAFAALVDDIHRSLDAHVLLLPFKTDGPDSDVAVCRAIAARASRPLRVSLAPLDLRPAEAVAVLQRAHFVVAMRHHGVLLSLVAGAPVLAIPYAPKTEHLVDEMGLGAYALGAGSLAPQLLRDAFWRAFAKRADQAGVVAPHLTIMRLRAQENFDRLRAFLAARERA